MDSPHKGQVMQKTIPYHYVTMSMSFIITKLTIGMSRGMRIILTHTWQWPPRWRQCRISILYLEWYKIYTCTIQGPKFAVTTRGYVSSKGYRHSKTPVLEQITRTTNNLKPRTILSPAHLHGRQSMYRQFSPKFVSTNHTDILKFIETDTIH